MKAEEMCKDERVKERVLHRIKEICKNRYKLRDYCVPQGVILITHNFTPQNQFLTVSHKLARHRVREHWKVEIETLYKSIEDKVENNGIPSFLDILKRVLQLSQDYTLSEGKWDLIIPCQLFSHHLFFHRI